MKSPRLLFLLIAPAMVHAAAVYNVSLDTSPLAGSAAGPFSIAVQLTDGSGIGDGNNIAVLTGFSFGGGSPIGGPLLFGSAFGDLSSGVILSDSDGIGFFAQPFIASSTLAFQLTMSTNPDAGAIPDAFFLSILDSTLTPLPTTSAGGLDVLAEIDVTGDTPLVSTFAGDPFRTPAAGGPGIALAAPQIASGIPEPGAGALAAIGLALLYCRKRSR